ncbi:MAG: hypothetical protein JSR62_03560 [Nitrospira sp.]|nr:hypothetical protein [Nitrospira sp.]
MKQNGTVLGMLTLVSMLAMTSVSSAGLFQKDETVGERFQKAIEKIRQSCERRTLAPGEVCGGVTKLTAADPLATEEGRFAHSIKIPNPVPEDSGYKPGMTSREYFDHLCKAEAGEFIYKTVENVEGLYMMRPREYANDYMQEHLYAMEDPYGYMDAESQDPEFLFVGPLRYKFLEHPLAPSKKPSWGKSFLDKSYFIAPSNRAQYERYLGSNGRDPRTMTKEYGAVRNARYGYTWRGIVRPHDREMGIAGGELIVLDLESGEVLGVRRGYIRTGNVRNNLTGVWWLTGQACPYYQYRAGRSRDFDFAYWFIGKVVKPINYEMSFRELTNVK